MLIRKGDLKESINARVTLQHFFVERRIMQAQRCRANVVFPIISVRRPTSRESILDLANVLMTTNYTSGSMYLERFISCRNLNL